MGLARAAAEIESVLVTNPSAITCARATRSAKDDSGALRQIEETAAFDEREQNVLLQVLAVHFAEHHGPRAAAGVIDRGPIMMRKARR